MKSFAVACAIACACRHSGNTEHTAELEIAVAEPGAVVDAVATGAMAPIERALSHVAHVVGIRGVARAGGARIVVDLDGGGDASLREVSAALNELPKDLPPPTVTARGTAVARYVLADERLTPVQLTQLAERASESIVAVAGVSRLVTCGELHTQLRIEADPRALAGAGLTISDLMTAVARAGGADPQALLEGTIATIAGVPIRIKDVATVHDGTDPHGCRAIDAHGDVVVLDIEAQPEADLSAVRAALAARLGALAPQATMRTIVVGLRPDVADPARAVVALRETVAGVPGVGAFLIEQAPLDDALDTMHVYLAASDPSAGEVIERLRELSFVEGAGEPTRTIVFTGADRDAVVRAGTAAALGFAQRHELVATRGLALHAVATHVVDRDAAARLGVEELQIDDLLAAEVGKSVATGAGGIDVVVHIDANAQDSLFVKSAAGTVPLGQLVRIESRPEPAEILHIGQLPAIELHVHADERDVRDELAALGFGADIHVVVEPVR